MVLRAGINDPAIEFVAINNRSPITDVYGIIHDSVHRKFPGDVRLEQGYLVVNGTRIKLVSESDPTKLPWRGLNIDVVVECTGVFRTKDQMMQHVRAGAKKVILSAPSKGEAVKTIVKGVNEHTLTKDDLLVSNASCTTNCFAPIAKVLHDNFGIDRGFMATVHAYTADQNLVDGSHEDPRRARGAAMNLCPTSSGAEKAVEEAIPELKGRLHSAAIRAPVPDGSLIYFVCELKREVSKNDLNALFKNCAGYHLKSVMEYSESPLVSTDIIGNTHSCIVDGQLTEADGRVVKIVAWYDNEFGYSCRMIDLVKLLG